MARVTIDRLSKQFGDVKAVDELSLEIADGTFVTLLGPSGCGKSTTLYCIAGLEEPSGGEIYFDGQRVTDLSPKDRDAALVFQDYALYPHMTVEDNLAFALKMRKAPKAETRSRVQQVAGILGIESLLKRRPSQLSGGQRQRVALGRALVRNPSVFLMDEPLSNLDALLRVNTRTEIKRLQRELGRTTIFVTHDQEEAMVVSDQIAIMRDGVIQQYSTPEETYRNPINTFVAGFIGNPRMNFLTGELSRSGNQLVLQSGGNEFPLPASLEALLNDQDRVTLGVRPEHLILGPTHEGDIRGRVDLIELVGPVAYVDTSIGERSLRATVNGSHNLSIGDMVGISFDSAHLHIFDPESGNRIV